VAVVAFFVKKDGHRVEPSTTGTSTDVPESSPSTSVVEETGDPGTSPLSEGDASSSDLDTTFGLNAEQKRRVEQLTSLFENGTTDLQYSYIKDLHDGRGYTAGRAGFCTACGDLYSVVKLYTQKVSNNPLAKYLDTLKKLADGGSDSTSGLKGFVDTWKNAAKDTLFKQAQDQVVDDTYYNPAMRKAQDLGLKTALAKAFLYDTIIQHGDGDDPDSFFSMLDRFNKAEGGSPKTGVDEKKWLIDFIKYRKKVLQNASDADTKDVWADSAGRCDVFLNIAQGGNYDLDGPIKVDTDDYNATIQ
jgi:chitosanase